MKILSLIPARMNSTRFPGKPIKLINNIPMIVHVFNNLKKSKINSDIYIATCDSEIVDVAKKNKISFVMTSNVHERASDRCAEALNKLEKKSKKDYDLVIMLQGDEPMIDPIMIRQSLVAFKKRDTLVTNLFSKIDNLDEFNDKNCIKVISDNQNNAIFFTRSLNKNYFGYHGNVGKQVCSIAFEKNFLKKFIKLKTTTFEKIESIDMNRAIEHGYSVFMQKTERYSQSVDTIEDLKKVEILLRKQNNNKNIK